MQQQMYPQPHTAQPQPGGAWMSQPQMPIGCPPGLEYLTMVDQLLCHQVIELLQVFSGWETNNRYAIKNSMGQQVYYAFEDTDVCMRCCCGANREFTIHIVNNYNQEVMRIYRPLKICACGPCCAGTCDECSHETFVEAPPGQLIGKVTQTQSICSFDFAIQDAHSNTQLIINGPCLMCRCCADVEWPVYTKDGAHQVGKVTKQWSGMVREMFTEADNFGIAFPMDLDVKVKATLLGAMFLIVMFFFVLLFLATL